MPTNSRNATDTVIHDTDTQRADRLVQIRDIVAEVFSAEPSQVEAAENIENDLETNSLLAIDLVIALEAAFGISIDNDELPMLMTDLRTLYQVVAEKARW